MEFPPDMKDVAWKVVESRTTKTSLRIQSLVLYCYLRACEIIDYWLPVKMTMREARRIWGPDMADEVLRDWVKASNHRRSTAAVDDPNIPKGATIDLSPVKVQRSVPPNGKPRHE